MSTMDAINSNEDKYMIKVSEDDAINAKFNTKLQELLDIAHSKKLPEAVNKYYTDNKTQYSTIEFNDVRLTYYKLKDGDKYTYSPVWVFAQCDKMEDGSLDKDYPIQLIMLDATTGDMIDLKDVLNQQTYDSSVVDSVIDSDSDFDISDDSLIDETDITDTDDADSSDESSADAIDIGDADIDMGDQDTTE